MVSVLLLKCPRTSVHHVPGLYIKRDGVRTDGIKGSVQKDKIFILRSGIAVERGDLLIRSMPHRGIEEYEVIEPNFMHGLGSIPAGYQADVRPREEITTVHSLSSPAMSVPESVISLV